jgi:hypothetical protein
MTRLHTFGCSITQGFALPDVVKTLTDDQGRPLTDDEVAATGATWEDIHIYQPSQYAWPKILADQLGIRVENHARRGACFNQIARQCVVAAPTILPEDIIIVMWTYLSRISLQWPARTSVPFCNIADPNWGLRTVILGFNKWFGLSGSKSTSLDRDQRIQQYIERTAKDQLDPMGVYDRYYRNIILQSTTAGLLQNTGARVIHISVETEPVLSQLDSIRSQLDSSLRDPYVIPDPNVWYDLDIDYHSCLVIHDPSIPPAENDMHPSCQHHENFAQRIYTKYFSPW